MYQRILLAIDLSDEADLLLKKAAALAKENSATLDVVHAVEWPLLGYDPMFGDTVIDVKSFVEDMAVAVKKRVEDSGVPVQGIHTLLGQTAVTITELAGKLQADLLVVGSHGKHGWRLLLGSTANAVLHTAPCDCLLVRVGKP